MPYPHPRRAHSLDHSRFAESQEHLLAQPLEPRAIEPVAHGVAHPGGEPLVGPRASTREESAEEIGLGCAAVIDGVTVEVGPPEVGEDRAQMRRLLCGCKVLDEREVAHADHADVAVAPRLPSSPFDPIGDVPLLYRSQESAEFPVKSAGTPRANGAGAAS